MGQTHARNGLVLFLILSFHYITLIYSLFNLNLDGFYEI